VCARVLKRFRALYQPLHDGRRLLEPCGIVYVNERGCPDDSAYLYRRVTVTSKKKEKNASGQEETKEITVMLKLACFLLAPYAAGVNVTWGVWSDALLGTSEEATFPDCEASDQAYVHSHEAENQEAGARYETPVCTSLKAPNER